MSVVKGQSAETSPVLFLNEKGEPMRFFIRPGPTKMQIQPLITNGGGVLCRTQEPRAIMLADPGEISSFADGAWQFYVSTQYIHDCVLQNQQVDLESYRFKNVQPIQTQTTSRKQRGSGRMGYSLEEDTAILDFISKRRQEAKGNRVWQLMARQGVTSHSWQSMKYRFRKHLQDKLTDSSPRKRRKVPPMKYSSSSDDNVSQNSPQMEVTLKKLPNSPSDSAVIHVSPDEGTPADQPEPQSLLEKNTSFQNAESENQLHALGNEAEKEPLSDEPDQEPLPEEEQQPHQQESEQLEVSPKRARADKEGTGKETSEGRNKQTTPIETRRKAPRKCGRKLGILERAAREFEDSQVVNGDNQEDRPPSRASSIVSDSDEGQIMAARERAVREQEGNVELCNSKQHAPQAQNNRCTIDGPVDSGAGPSNAAIPVTSNAHMFIFDQETQEDLTHMSQTESLTQDILETKQQVVNLMQESKKDLVEVTRALLKASGDVTLARSYLLKGYNRKEHGPLWTRGDDEVLLLADPSVLEQLIEKYGADRVSTRRRFLQVN